VNGRVLVVDDDRAMCEMLASALARAGFDAVWRTAAAAARAALDADDIDVVVSDVNLGDADGIALCAELATAHPELPVVMITAFGSMESAIAAIRAGAYDFVTKPFAVELLIHALERAIRHRRMRAEVKRLRAAAGEAAPFAGLIGASEPMQNVARLIARVAASEVSVLVSGETGTGKEIVARALHERGRRRDRPFIAVNCAALPEPLLESELFGHARGAFTDARSPRTGLFLRASGGTLFLDEIAELPLGLQPKLLRALQERVVRPVGSDVEVPFDVRLVTATNRDLESAVAAGRFREDLFYRINVVNLALPPLRSRGNDVLLLAQHFLSRYAERSGKSVVGLSAPAAERLLAYDWPGNVRELQNCIERALALTQYDHLAVDDLPEKIRAHRREYVVVASTDPAELASMEEVERRYVARVLEAVAGNKTLAARILGFDRKTLYRKLEHYAARGGGDA
jgi:two-component system response regulator HydG